MDIAVTGASGHIGANLIRELLSQGRSIRVLLKDDARAFEGLDIEVIQGDILDPESLLKLFNGVNIAYHLAGKISIISSEQDDVFQTNIKGTQNVVEACIKCGIKRLVYFSSLQAFCSDPVNEIITENREFVCNNDFCYDWSKAAAQHEVQKGIRNGLDAVIVNPAGVVGPNDFKPSSIGRVLLDIYNNRMPALVEGGYNWVDVRDVVKGAITAEKKGRNGECYLLSGHWKEIREIAEIITLVTGKKTPRLIAPTWLSKYASYFAVAYSKIINKKPKFTPYAIKRLKTHRHISHSKATKELGFIPRPFEETIKDTLMWFKENRRV
ncbi:SDR family oxidoreductase [Spirochaetota bacterium]